MEHVELKRVAGIAARCSNDAPASIGVLWERFFREGVASRVNGKGMYAVYLDYESDFTGPYTLLLGEEIALDAALPDGLDECFVEAGTYKTFDASGQRPLSILAGWRQVWASDIPRAYRTDFERYGAGEQATIFIGIRA